MKTNRALRVVLPATLVVAALFAGCGEDGTPVADAGPSDASVTEDARALTDTEAPDAPDAERADARDGASDAPTRAPFGIDARPPNPTCVAPARPPKAARAVRFTRVFAGAGLNQPMTMAQIPGDRTRWFAAEREGRVVSFAATNPVGKTVVATVPGQVYAQDESGLLGMAFHPKFAQNGYLYLFYTSIDAELVLRSVIIRMQSADNGLSFSNPVTILGPVEPPGPSHRGGDLHFGPDGYLYASFGDGNDPANGQRTTGFLAKILRLDVDSAFPYAIPDGNPFKAGGGEPTTFAYGFRNPYRFSVDSVSGDVWAGDVGEVDWEEVDHVVAGGNYGWSHREGRHCYPAGTTGCPTAGLIDPWWEGSHDDALYCVLGGPIYRGAKMPTMVGKYLAADCGSQVFSVAADPATGVAASTTLNAEGPSETWIGVVEDNDHEVYLLTHGSEVFALDEEPGQPPLPPFPDALSKTGCFDPTDTKRPGPGLLPYTPSSPFWSDGAAKERFLALPEGKTITVLPSGDFDFPNGAVLIKHFRVDSRLVETRLFVRHTDGDWGGYSYEWNDAQTDATLLPANKTKALAGGRSWYFPSRGECFSCHTAAAGRSLGLELGQLNDDFVYPSTNRISNQLRTLDHLALFTQPLADPSTLPAYPSPSGGAPVEARARSYLHSNCSHCHQPGGPGRGSMDLRFGQTLRATGTCNGAPIAGDLGIAGARLVLPGNPASSLVSVRMRAEGPTRMPPVASRRVDTTGSQLIDDWIRSIAACPP